MPDIPSGAWQTEAFEQHPDIIVVFDSNHRVQAANRRACDILGATMEQLMNQSCEEVCECGRGKQHCLIRKTIATKEPVSELEHRRMGKLKSPASMVVTAVPITDKTGNILGGMEIMRDFSLLDDAEQDLVKMAETDDLTGLSRRHVMFDALQQEQARFERHRRPFAVFMIDIDDFKHYNDRFGHQAGDEILREVGRVLTSETRDVDTVCRYGGEEFVVILPETGLDEARTAANRILEEFRTRTPALAPDGKSVTLSIGISLCESDGESVTDRLIQRADDALYVAKAGGKNRAMLAE